MSFAWSYSRLKNYETCGLRHLHYDVLKDIEEGESPQIVEGHDVHKAFELRVSENKKLPLGLARHEPWIRHLMDPPGECFAEQKLALNSLFQPVGWFADDVWFRCVIDFTKMLDHFAVIVDYKSGKVVEDDTQLALQAAIVFHHIESVQRIRAAFAFINSDKVITKTYYRSDLPLVWADVLPRVRRLESAQNKNEYKPNPSGLCVKYCKVESCIYHGRGTR